MRLNQAGWFVNDVVGCTVKLGYNDHGYNEFTAITNKYSSTFLVPNGTFTS